jgi:hypothetical protein
MHCKPFFDQMFITGQAAAIQKDTVTFHPLEDHQSALTEAYQARYKIMFPHWVFYAGVSRAPGKVGNTLPFRII